MYPTIINPNHITVFLLSYIIGSIPFGIIIGKLKGIDIREIGSKNIGATNVARALGIKYGILTAILDGIKGMLCIIITIHLLSNQYAGIAILGSTIGHIYPLFLKFKGGKGVATFAFSLIPINSNLFAVFATIWVVILAITRYSSLSAILATTITTIYQLLQVQNNKEDFDLAIIITIIAIIILYKHKDNIKRLVTKTESKINHKTK